MNRNKRQRTTHLGKPRQIRGKIQNRAGDDECTFDDGDQVLNDEDHDPIGESLTTGAIAQGHIGLEPRTKENGMSDHNGHRMNAPKGKGVARRNLDRNDVGKTDTELHDMGKEWPRKQKNVGGGVSERFKDGAHMGEGMTPNDIANLIEDDGADLQALFNQYVQSAQCVTLSEFCEYAQAYGMAVADDRILLGLMAANRDFMFSEHADAQGRYWTPAVVEEEQKGEGDDKAVFCKKCYTKHKPSEECKSKDESRRRGQALTEAADFDVETPKRHVGRHSDPFVDDESMNQPEEFNHDNDPSGERAFNDKFGDGFDGDEFGAEDMPHDAGDGPMTGCPECGGEMDEYGACAECGYDEGGGSMGASFEGGAADPIDVASGREEQWPIDGDETEFAPGAAGAVGIDRFGDADERMRRPHRPHESRQRPVVGGLTGRPIYEDGNGTPTYKTHEGAPADHGGHKMDSPVGNSSFVQKPKKHPGLPQEPTNVKEMGKEWPRKQKNVGSAQEADRDSEHAEASDGITSKVHDLNLKNKQKNVGQQWETFDGEGYGDAQMKVGGGPSGGGLGGGAKKMHENVERLSRHVTKLLQQYMQESGSFRRPGSYPVTFTIGAGDWVLPKKHANMTEALADAEELLQIFGPDHVSLEARYQDSDGVTLMRRMVPLIRLGDRGPIMAENRSLFRFPELARDFADVLVKEGKTCRAVSHNWGAAVTARIPYRVAVQAYDAIREESARNMPHAIGETSDVPSIHGPGGHDDLGGEELNQHLVGEGEFDGMTDEELLQTPESKWLDKIDPQRLQQIAAEHPEHGSREAAAKLLNISNYGPEYQDSARTLKMIARIWPISLKDVMHAAGEMTSGDDGLLEHLKSEAAKYGIR